MVDRIDPLTNLFVVVHLYSGHRQSQSTILCSVCIVDDYIYPYAQGETVIAACNIGCRVWDWRDIPHGLEHVPIT